MISDSVGYARKLLRAIDDEISATDAGIVGGALDLPGYKTAAGKRHGLFTARAIAVDLLGTDKRELAFDV